MTGFRSFVLSLILLALITIVSGHFLNRSGAPYGGVGFNVHKFAALILAVVAVILVNRMWTVLPPDALELWTAVAAVLFFIGAVITGGLLSVEKDFPEWVNLLHRVLPMLTIIFTGLNVYLLFHHR